jgi:hypothetical protein
MLTTDKDGAVNERSAYVFLVHVRFTDGLVLTQYTRDRVRPLRRLIDRNRTT